VVVTAWAIRADWAKNLATLSSTGTPSFFCIRGGLARRLGMLARGDAMLAVSYGGETEEIIRLLGALKRWKCH